MKTIWNNTMEGRQYWVQVKRETLQLEFSSDPVSELVGGGYSYNLPDNFADNPELLAELTTIFGENSLHEILALSRTLKKISCSDYENKTSVFNQIYYQELTKETIGS